MQRDTVKGLVLGVVGCLAMTSSVAYATTYLDWSIDQFRMRGRLELPEKWIVGTDDDGNWEPDRWQGAVRSTLPGEGGLVSETTGYERNTLVGTELRLGWADLEARYVNCDGLDADDATDYDALYDVTPEPGRHLTLGPDPCPAKATVDDGWLLHPSQQVAWPSAPAPDTLLDQPTALIENPHIDDEGQPRAAALELGGALKIRRIDRQLTPTDGESHDAHCLAAGGCGMAYDLYVDFDGNLVVVAFDEDGNRLGIRPLVRRAEFYSIPD